jgi:ATP-dependent Clp protease ATP-binding subunit ClpB
MPINWQRLTLKSQEAIQRAQEIALERQHQTIEPLHLLAALLEDTSGVVPSVLQQLEVNRTLLQRKLEEELQTAPSGQRRTAAVPFARARLAAGERLAGSHRAQG